MKSPTNSVRSSRLRPAQWRERARRATSSKSKSSRAIRLISTLRSLGTRPLASVFWSTSMTCTTADSTVSRGLVVGAATAPATINHAANALPMALPPRLGGSTGRATARRAKSSVISKR